MKLSTSTGLFLPIFNLLSNCLGIAPNKPITNDFFNCYLAAPRLTLGHYLGGSLTYPMLITKFLHIRTEGHQEPRSEVGSLSPIERLAWFKSGTFWKQWCCDFCSSYQLQPDLISSILLHVQSVYWNLTRPFNLHSLQRFLVSANTASLLR